MIKSVEGFDLHMPVSAPIVDMARAFLIGEHNIKMGSKPLPDLIVKADQGALAINMEQEGKAFDAEVAIQNLNVYKSSIIVFEDLKRVVVPVSDGVQWWIVVLDIGEQKLYVYLSSVQHVCLSSG